MEFLGINFKNMYTFLLHMANSIRFRKVVNSRTNNVFELTDFGKVAWSFISSIYKAGWDSLPINKDIDSFRSKFMSKFTPKTLKINSASTLGKSKGKVAEIIRLPLSKIKVVDLTYFHFLFYFHFSIFRT